MWSEQWMEAGHGIIGHSKVAFTLDTGATESIWAEKWCREQRCHRGGLHEGREGESRRTSKDAFTITRRERWGTGQGGCRESGEEGLNSEYICLTAALRDRIS